MANLTMWWVSRDFNIKHICYGLSKVNIYRVWRVQVNTKILKVVNTPCKEQWKIMTWYWTKHALNTIFIVDRWFVQWFHWRLSSHQGTWKTSSPTWKGKVLNQKHSSRLHLEKICCEWTVLTYQTFQMFNFQ